MYWRVDVRKLAESELVVMPAVEAREAGELLLFALKHHRLFGDAMLRELAERLGRYGYSFKVDEENTRIDVKEPKEEEEYEEFFSGLEDVVESIVRDVARDVVINRGFHGEYAGTRVRVGEDDVFVERELVEGGDTEFRVYERRIAALTREILGEAIPVITVHMCYDCCSVIVLTIYDLMVRFP